MNDRDFFQTSADKCRQFALRARTDSARRELLLWARELEAVAEGREPMPARRSQLQDAAD